MVHAGAAVALDGRAEEAERAHLVEDLAVELLVAVRLDDARHQLLLAVGARAVAHHALVLGELVLEEQRVFPLERAASCRWVSRRAPGFHLRLQVVLQADLADQLDLRLDPVDVVLGVVEDLLEDLARDVILDRLAVGDALLQSSPASPSRPRGRRRASRARSRRCRACAGSACSAGGIMLTDGPACGRSAARTPAQPTREQVLLVAQQAPSAPGSTRPRGTCCRAARACLRARRCRRRAASRKSSVHARRVDVLTIARIARGALPSGRNSPAMSTSVIVTGEARVLRQVPRRLGDRGGARSDARRALRRSRSVVDAARSAQVAELRRGRRTSPRRPDRRRARARRARGRQASRSRRAFMAAPTCAAGCGTRPSGRPATDRRRMIAGEPDDRHVEVEEQRALRILAHHALDPEERRRRARRA